MLVVTVVRNGAEIDRVSLVDGKLTYATGAARAIVEGRRNKYPDLTDQRLYELAAGSSNGYIAISVDRP